MERGSTNVCTKKILLPTGGESHATMKWSDGNVNRKQHTAISGDVMKEITGTGLHVLW